MTEQKEQLKAAVRQLTHFLSEGIWEEDIQRRGGVAGFFLHELRILVIVTRSLARGQIPLRAAAMTLASLLALIPGIVLTFTLIGAFGGFEGVEEQLRRFIIENLISTVQEQVSAFLKSFLEGVNSGAFQGISLFFLLGAVLGLLATVEDAFNQIWGIKRGRSLPHRLTTYTTIAILAPFLIGISLTATVSVRSEILGLFQGVEHLSGFTQSLVRLLPFLITVLGLTLLYMVMPNTKVRFLSALPSAALAGVVWEISKWGYGLYLSSRTMYSSLYGSLAAIPLLFIWIQFSWVIVLGGASLTFARETAQEFLVEEGAVTASYLERVRAALRCMLAICRSHQEGCSAPNVGELASRLQIPVRLVRTAVGDLLAGKLLHEVIRRPDKGEGGLVPARNLQSLSVYDVLACLQSAGTSTSPPGAEPEAEEVERILTEVDARLKGVGETLTFAQIIETLQQREAQSPPPVELLPRGKRN